MKIVTILGARPQFVKAAMVSRAIRAHPGVHEVIVHTGQHFDSDMSSVFFDQLDIPRPAHYLHIASLSHGAMTGRMLEKIESILTSEKPDWVLVYGDTNSTLAGALAASKLQIPLAHVESGLRSNNLAMPEEINRALTDRVSDLLLCPSTTAIDNLRREGYPFPTHRGRTQRVEVVGDVMFDAVCYFRQKVKGTAGLESFGIRERAYALCTLHRQDNTDDPERLASILGALREIAKELPVVLPLHPRTRKYIEKSDTNLASAGLIIVAPQPYLEMQRLQMSAKVILTDSGGVQKEAFFHQVPCITLREETEWVETVEFGWNRVVGTDRETILLAWRNTHAPVTPPPNIYGDGKASEKVLAELLR